MVRSFARQFDAEEVRQRFTDNGATARERMLGRIVVHEKQSLKGKAFVVFLDTDGKVFPWRWENADPEREGYPEKWREGLRVKNGQRLDEVSGNRQTKGVPAAPLSGGGGGLSNVLL
jgi:hypothetical protein